jgi:Ca-activated chloride channel homolog
MQHSVLVDHELALSQQGFIVRALVRLTGRAPERENRVPINISIVLDRSGSMAGEKLEAAQEAAAFLVERLAPEDIVSVVAYDDHVETIVPPSTGTEQADAARSIRSIEVRGCTNLSGGWLRGRELVAQRIRAGAVNRVLLLTDGLANAGITDPARLCGLAGGGRSAGVTTSTIGFGEGYDEILLRGMADGGGGNSWYIERPDQAPGVFEEEIGGLLSLSAQNVAVEIHPSDAVQLVAVHNDYPYTDIPGGGRRFELGDLYAREPRSMLVEFFVPGIDDLASASIAEVRIHAHVLTDAGSIERQEIIFAVASPLGQAGHAEPEVRRELLLLETARAREDAVRLERQGDIDGASGVLREAVHRIALAPLEYRAGLDEQASDIEAMSSSLVAEGWQEADRKYANQRAYNARRGKQGYEEKLRRGKGPAGS